MGNLLSSSVLSGENSQAGSLPTHLKVADGKQEIYEILKMISRLHVILKYL